MATKLTTVKLEEWCELEIGGYRQSSPAAGLVEWVAAPRSRAFKVGPSRRKIVIRNGFHDEREEMPSVVRIIIRQPAPSAEPLVKAAAPV